MRYKLLGAVICVMIMIACPLIAAVPGSDGADETRASADIVVKNLTNDQVNDLFDNTVKKDVEYTIALYIFPVIGLNHGIIDCSDLTSTVSNLNYDCGSGKTFANDKESATSSNYQKIECEIDLSYKINIDNTINALSSSYGFEGEGREELIKSFGQYTLTKDDVVHIKGKVTIENYSVIEYSDVFNTNEDKYYPKKIETTEGNKLEFDLSVNIKGKEFKDEYSSRAKFTTETNYDIINGALSDYKAGSLQSVKYSEDLIIDESAGKKTIDDYVYKYDRIDRNFDGNYGPVAGYGPSALSTDTEVKYSSLLFFTAEDDVIAEKVGKYNGTASKNDYDAFNDRLSSVKSDFKVEENNNLNIFFAIAAVIIVLMALMFYFNKKKIKS